LIDAEQYGLLCNSYIGLRVSLIILDAIRSVTLVFLASSPYPDSEKSQLEIDYYHRDISKMDVVTVCETCHSQNGRLDFIALGFTEKRANVLINTNINSIISNYKKFYIPHILK